MSALEIVPATALHAAQMAPLLRGADRRELARLGMTGEAALALGLHDAAVAWAALEPADGAVVAMWGVMAPQLLGDVARPWVLTASGIERRKASFLRESRRRLAVMAAMWPRLESLVDAEYRESLGWLAAIGFSLGPAVAMPPFGHPFRICRYGAW